MPTNTLAGCADVDLSESKVVFFNEPVVLGSGHLIEPLSVLEIVSRALETAKKKTFK
jgi:hypothetical protein